MKKLIQVLSIKELADQWNAQQSLQVDGPADSSDEEDGLDDDDDGDDDDDDDDDDLDPDGEEDDEGVEEDPLGSEDDISDEDARWYWHLMLEKKEF